MWVVLLYAYMWIDMSDKVASAIILWQGPGCSPKNSMAMGSDCRRNNVWVYWVGLCHNACVMKFLCCLWYNCSSRLWLCCLWILYLLHWLTVEKGFDCVVRDTWLSLLISSYSSLRGYHFLYPHILLTVFVPWIPVIIFVFIWLFTLLFNFIGLYNKCFVIAS